MPGSTVNGASSTTLSTVLAAPSSSFFLKPKHICFLTPTRRDFAFLSFLSSTTSFLSSPASAIEFGICTLRATLLLLLLLLLLILLNLTCNSLCSRTKGLVERTEEEVLQLLISTSETDTTYSDEDLQKIQDLFRSAARDCVPEDRNSFVNFQANTGVEVCTFRLIVKNAASLRASKDPVKLKAEALLDNLIRNKGNWESVFEKMQNFDNINNTFLHFGLKGQGLC
ncbi:hypothetical protein TanjilG_12379 [Lupinus angustifolius]|uniref:Uncharacterized protein n=1 Tax=Lupinus angustifolius TaxID=3871 RepID=A0A4P1QYA3_LUPAN|nr:hypothetical protein TanjilG_12379 [Lupinus angustifolius]